MTSRNEWRIPLSVDTRLSLALLRVDSVSVNRAPKTHKKSPVNRPAVDGRPAWPARPLTAVAVVSPDADTSTPSAMSPDHLRPFDC